jgi:hypothetical protein
MNLLYRLCDGRAGSGAFTPWPARYFLAPRGWIAVRLLSNLLLLLQIDNLLIPVGHLAKQVPGQVRGPA